MLIWQCIHPDYLSISITKTKCKSIPVTLVNCGFQFETNHNHDYHTFIMRINNHDSLSYALKKVFLAIVQTTKKMHPWRDISATHFL